MRLALPLVAFALLLAPAPARAQAFGQWTEARALELNGRLGGGYLLLSSHTVGGVGQLRLSLHPGFELGFQGGLQRVNDGGSRTALQLGVDGRGQALARSRGDEVDLAIGGCLGVETADNVTRLLLGPSVVASRAFETSAGPLIPFAGATVMFSRVTAFDAQDGDLSLPLRFGADFSPQIGLHFIGEIQLRISDDHGDTAVFSIGLQSPF